MVYDEENEQFVIKARALCFPMLLHEIVKGLYEIVGTEGFGADKEKIQGNPEKIKGHSLIRHGEYKLSLEDDSFEYLKEYLSNPDNDIEGIVFHHKTDGRMCKLRKSDFGIKR